MKKLHRHTARRDEGSILPLVLVMTVVLATLVVALASYVSAGLRYTTVVEDRADRLAAVAGVAQKRRGHQRLSARRPRVGR